MDKKTKLMVIGIDAATWRIINPNIDKLPNFKKLMEEGQHKTITLKEGESVLSPAIWCTMFSGKTLEEHGHEKYVMDKKLRKRSDIKVDFVWDLLKDKCNIVTLQAPFVMPPYNFNCEFKSASLGVSHDMKEIEEETDGITKNALEIAETAPDIFIVCYTALDRVQHFHWGEDETIMYWYKKIDDCLGKLTPYADKLIIISDHGFCGRGEARTKTLPDKNELGEELKGDHHEEAILITKNINYDIREPKDVFYAIMSESGFSGS